MTELVNKRTAAREDTLRLQNEQQLLKQSSHAIAERLRLMDESAHQQSLATHDRRHFNGMVLELLERDATEDAAALLRRQTAALPSGDRRYCENTEVNAAVCYYAAPFYRIENGIFTVRLLV